MGGVASTPPDRARVKESNRSFAGPHSAGADMVALMVDEHEKTVTNESCVILTYCRGNCLNTYGFLLSGFIDIAIKLNFLGLSHPV